MIVAGLERPTIYSRNMQILVTQFPDVVRQLESADTSSIRVVPARDRGLTMRTSDNITLHSVVDPIREARDLIQAWEIGDCKRWLIFGFGLGHHLKAALESSNSIDEMIAVEFCPEVVKAALESVDLTDLLSWSGLQIWIPDDHPSLEQLIDHMSGDHRMMIHPPSLALWRRRKLPVADILDAVELQRMNWHYSGADYAQAIKRNHAEFAVRENVESYLTSLRDQPIVIAGAGPSLDGAKPLIRRYRSSLFVIAANAAFLPLRDAGIRPDAVICVEPRPAARSSFDGKGEEGIPLLFVPGTNPDVVANWHGPKLVATRQKDGSLPHTGTVVGAALDVAIRLGGNPIILTGVDLALTGRWYAQGVRKSSSESAGKSLATSPVPQPASHTCQVIGVDGNMVPSTPAFRHFARSLEMLIQDARIQNPALTIYDLKNRGARIGGTNPLPPTCNSIERVLFSEIKRTRPSSSIEDLLSTGARP